MKNIFKKNIITWSLMYIRLTIKENVKFKREDLKKKKRERAL